MTDEEIVMMDVPPREGDITPDDCRSLTPPGRISMINSLRLGYQRPFCTGCGSSVEDHYPEEILRGERCDCAD